ncbi:MAG: hypothetical protein IJS73_00415 [Paludibacteraceae bacterium]|nr:hypothetical protein [Paludibacteraceae bacterium]
MKKIELGHLLWMKITSMAMLLCLAGGIITMCYAQNESTLESLKRQIDDLESQIAKLESELKQNDSKKNDTTKIYCFERIIYKEVPTMNDEQFLAFCKNEIPEWNARQGNANYTIVSSCKQTPNGLQANYCVTTDANVINPLKPNLQKQEIEKELAKIKNTKQMYKDLIASLKEELKSNGIVIVDEGLNLAIKQIELSGSEISALTQDMQYLKDNMLESLGKKYNISKQNIENENAQLVDDLTNMAEKLLSYIPGGDKVTNHYLWRILKSTPEIGKILGNSGAIINIYFQIDEFQKKLQQLEERENALISIEQKDIVIAK